MKKLFKKTLNPNNWTQKTIKVINFTLIGVLVIIIITVALFSARYFFSPRWSSFTIVLDSVNDFTFEANDEHCLDGSFFPRPSVVYFAHAPLRTEYLVSAEVEPADIRVSLIEGVVKIAGWNSGKIELEETATLSKDGNSMNVTGKSMAIDLGDRDDINLEGNICAHFINFDPPSGTIYTRNNFPLLAENSYSSVITEHSFVKAQQDIEITINEVQWGDRNFEKLAIRFTSGENYQASGMRVEIVGNYVSYQLPDAMFSDDIAIVRLRVSEVEKVTINQPVGSVSLENDEIFQLESPLSYLDNRELVVGGGISNYIALFPEADGKFQISGGVYSILYQNQQLLKSPWQSIPIELQAVLITAAIGLMAWLGKDVLVKTLLSSSSSKGFEEPKIPTGFAVLYLSSGRTVMGKLIKRPNRRNKYFVLVEVSAKEPDGWKSYSAPEMRVDGTKVDYFYIQNE